jgi:hypothetical protein
MFATAFLVFYATFPLRALRWRLLLRNADVPVDAGRQSWASLRALMEYIYLSWFANCVVPAKLGDAYRGYLLKTNGQVSFSASFGTIFAERLLDMVGLFAFLVVSGWMVFGTHLPPTTRLIFVSGLVLVVVIVMGLAGMRWLGPLVHRLVPERVRRPYQAFEQAALRSFQPAVLPRLLLRGAVSRAAGGDLHRAGVIAADGDPADAGRPRARRRDGDCGAAPVPADGDDQ